MYLQLSQSKPKTTAKLELDYWLWNSRSLDDRPIYFHLCLKGEISDCGWRGCSCLAIIMDHGSGMPFVRITSSTIPSPPPACLFWPLLVLDNYVENLVALFVLPQIFRRKRKDKRPKVSTCTYAVVGQTHLVIVVVAMMTFSLRLWNDRPNDNDKQQALRLCSAVSRTIP